jgi:hypothetical protein
MGMGVKLALGVARQVHALEPVLVQQPRGVLVGAVWPWAVRDRQRIPESPTARPYACARPSLPRDHRSALGAAARAHAGGSC